MGKVRDRGDTALVHKLFGCGPDGRLETGVGKIAIVFAFLQRHRQWHGLGVALLGQTLHKGTTTTPYRQTQQTSRLVIGFSYTDTHTCKTQDVISKQARHTRVL